MSGIGGKREQFACDSTRFGIGIQCVAERSYRTRRQPLERVGARRCDLRKARTPGEKSADNDLVRRVENDWGAAARGQCAVRERESGKAVEVRRLERQRRQL